MNSLLQHFEVNQEINIVSLKEALSSQASLPINLVKALVFKFLSIVKNEPNVVTVNGVVQIVGDLHGQYYDLLKILSLLPSLDQSQQSIIFLGDYVDRGFMGIQVTILLMAYKITYPKKIFMLRGNHQTRQMTQTFNFYSQACTKYNSDIYFDIMDAFDALPLICIVNEKYFCVHGGISSEGESLEKIQKLNRFDQIPLKGTLCDLVWADPVTDDEGKMSGGKISANYQRNCSIFFGSQHARTFLKQNKLVTIIRAHEVQKDGYKLHMWRNWKNVPMVYTIFSAPNYCGTYHNLGAFLTIREGHFSIRQFKQTDPKYYVPLKYNAFSFSIESLFNFSSEILKKMIKSWVVKYMPELQTLSQKQLIEIYLNSQKQKVSKRIQQSSFHSKRQSKSSISQFGEISLLNENQPFRKSIQYFKQSQKRPNNSLLIRGQAQ